MYVPTIYIECTYTNNHVYSTQEENQTEAKKYSKERNPKTHTHIKQEHVILIYSINIELPSSLNLYMHFAHNCSACIDIVINSRVLVHLVNLIVQ